jgi:magnesium-transporting ATPase (P-type)
MDELELLKKDWDKDSSKFINYSDLDIYSMLHKKSSSIVKTLLYISIGELVFWLLAGILPYLLTTTFRKKLDDSYENYIFLGLSIFSYVVILAFIYLLFKSYKGISSTDNAKILMENILKIRHIIKYYVFFNLLLIFISVPLTFYVEYQDNPEFHQHVTNASSKDMIAVYATIIITAGVFLCVLWLLYKLIYGVLLKRLNHNYKELQKLEIQ